MDIEASSIPAAGPCIAFPDDRAANEETLRGSTGSPEKGASLAKLSEDLPRSPARPSATLRRLPGALAVFVVSACLLCSNLGSRYLWQDEAHTAVLGQRLMSSGRPLAYDGRNLVTMDLYFPDEVDKLPTGDAGTAVEYHVRRGDFRTDTTWIGQPWGQFVAAGASLALFGRDTVQARLPFALAGALTVTMLYAMVRRRFGSHAAAIAAAVLLLGNSFWFIHMRQCRYYALSSLFLLVTLETYLRWREDRRWGGAVFIAAAWVWFQTDYGSVWPVLGILGLHALVTGRNRIGETVSVFAGLFALMVPFCLFYQLAGKTKYAATLWSDTIGSMLFELNQFQLPLIVIPAVLCLLWLKRKDTGGSPSRTLAGLSLAAVCSLTLWMAVAGPFPFYRYIVPATSLSVIVIVYGFFESAKLLPVSKTTGRLVPAALAAAVVLFLVTNLPSWPGALVFPEKFRLKYYLSPALRPEIRFALADLTGNGEDDPNRAAVEYLRRHIEPGDEILCNYEDIPLMFYLRNPVRGGISCFRVEDAGNVRFAVLRRSAGFTHAAIYSRRIRRDRWSAHVTNAPDIPWGNFPDPRFHYVLLAPGAQSLVILERE